MMNGLDASDMTPFPSTPAHVRHEKRALGERRYDPTGLSDRDLGERRPSEEGTSAMARDGMPRTAVPGCLPGETVLGLPPPRMGTRARGRQERGPVIPSARRRTLIGRTMNGRGFDDWAKRLPPLWWEDATGDGGRSVNPLDKYCRNLSVVYACVRFASRD